MVMFTDGKTTAGPDPNPVAAAARVDGIDPAVLDELTIPAHFSTSCRDVLVKCVKFILPEDLDVSGGSTTAMCNTRNFKARVFAHNIDSDFYCCNNVTF